MDASDASVELWTTGQAAECLRAVGLDRQQVYRLVANGTLPSIRKGRGSWARIPASAVIRYRDKLLAQLDNADRNPQGP